MLWPTRWSRCCNCCRNLRARFRFRNERMESAAQSGYLNAMAAATYLVHKGVPFRTAHEKIGNAVRFALEKGVELDQLSLEELRAFGPEFAEDFFAAIGLNATLDCHEVMGGTARGRLLFVPLQSPPPSEVCIDLVASTTTSTLKGAAVPPELVAVAVALSVTEGVPMTAAKVIGTFTCSTTWIRLASGCPVVAFAGLQGGRGTGADVTQARFTATTVKLEPAGMLYVAPALVDPLYRFAAVVAVPSVMPDPPARAAASVADWSWRKAT